MVPVRDGRLIRVAGAGDLHASEAVRERLASSFGAKDAGIVSVSPGSIDTAMGRLEADHGAAEMLKFAAIKRFGSVEEIAEVLAFCASDKARYLTGTDVLCDGGVVAGVRRRDLLRVQH